jgi:chlorite dismutase
VSEEKTRGRRQVAKFSFYRIDPAWRALPSDERERGKQEFRAAVEAFSDRLQIRSYSVAGMRGDADLLLWQIGDSLDDVQRLAAAINGTCLGPHVTMPYSYLAMTRPSVYVSGREAAARQELHPAESRYFFVYPFVKTREWYQLPLAERQGMMDEHIRIGRKYPSVKLNTTYSFGLDDQEFVVSFETDEPADFLDLVMELREAKTSLYTLRDTPIFTCIAMGLKEALDTLDGTWGVTKPVFERSMNGVRWTSVAQFTDLERDGAKVVYVDGEQIALFGVSGVVYAVTDRCPHANALLSEGTVKGTSVICSSHGSEFDLTSGNPVCGPASRPLTRYDVKVEDGQVYIAAGDSMRKDAAGETL